MSGVLSILLFVALVAVLEIELYVTVVLDVIMLLEVDLSSFLSRILNRGWLIISLNENLLDSSICKHLRINSLLSSDTDGV